MVEDPVDHGYPAQRRRAEEIRASDPAMVQLRVEPEHGDRVLIQTAPQSRPAPRHLELECSPFNADLPEVFAQILRIDPIVLMARVADPKMPCARRRPRSAKRPRGRIEEQRKVVGGARAPTPRGCHHVHALWLENMCAASNRP